MLTLTTKFYEIMLSGFRRVAMTNCLFNSIFNSKFKGGTTPRIMNESEFPASMQFYMVFRYKLFP